MEEWLTKTLASQFSDAARQDLVDTYCVSGGFIAVRPTDFDRCMARDDVFAGLRRLAVLGGLIEAFQPLGIRREAETLIVRCATGEQAIHLALSLLQFKEAHPLGIAVSAGRVFQSPGMELFGSRCSGRDIWSRWRGRMRCWYLKRCCVNYPFHKG